MTKTRTRGVRAPRNSRVKRPVSCGFVKRKKRGHEHIMILTKNTKKQNVNRCKICKHHFFIILHLRKFFLRKLDAIIIECQVLKIF